MQGELSVSYSFIDIHSQECVLLMRSLLNGPIHPTTVPKDTEGPYPFKATVSADTLRR
jgi:hypothetical protein